jgi:hypothetical protein
VAVDVLVVLDAAAITVEFGQFQTSTRQSDRRKLAP